MHNVQWRMAILVYRTWDLVKNNLRQFFTSSILGRYKISETSELFINPLSWKLAHLLLLPWGTFTLILASLYGCSFSSRDFVYDIQTQTGGHTDR